MLFSHYLPPENNQAEDKPLLVFVHGFLGSGDDWQQVLKRFSDYPRLTIDLPGHGRSADISTQGFDETGSSISQTIAQQLISENLPEQISVVVVGYSLGARLVMYAMTHGGFSDLNIAYLFIEGGNFGLKSETEKANRLKNDTKWSERFAAEPMENVLQDWYLQSVFSSLTPLEREELVKKRGRNQGQVVANMLLSTSLAHQPYLLERVKLLQTPVEYICGDKDQKFFELAAQSKLSFTAVADAGHNVHVEQPDRFAQLIRTKLGEYSPDTEKEQSWK